MKQPQEQQNTEQHFSIPNIDWQPFVELKLITDSEKRMLDDVSPSQGIQGIIESVVDESNNYIELFMKILMNIHQDEVLVHVLWVMFIVMNGKKFSLILNYCSFKRICK